MNRYWQKHYPEHVPLELDMDPTDTLVHLYQRSCTAFQTQTAFIALDTPLSYQQLTQYSQQVAHYYQCALHLKPGDRIALMLPNILQYPIAMFAALEAG